MFLGIGTRSSVTQTAGAPAGGNRASPKTLVVEVKTKAPTPALTASSSRFSVPVMLVSTKSWRLCVATRSEEHTSELQSLMRISYAVFCLKKKKTIKKDNYHQPSHNHQQE